MVDKCSKKDCVDFDVSKEDMDLTGNCNVCRNNRQNPTWPNDPDEYLRVENIVDPTADVPVPDYVLKPIEEAIIEPAVEAMQEFGDAYPALPWTEEDGEISEEVYDALSSTGSAFGWNPNAAQTALLKLESKDVLLKGHSEAVPPCKNGYTIKEGLKHNEIEKDIKDSGARTEFETGAVRDAQGGKGRFDLQPLLAMWALAHHVEKGCIKYGDRNWEKGIPIKNFIDSAERHLKEFQLGLTDENHMAAALWNIACCYETLVRIDMGILPRSLDKDIPYVLRGVIKNSEDVKPWDRLKDPLYEVK